MSAVGPVEAVLRFRALSAGWITLHVLVTLTDLSYADVETELARLVRDKKVIARRGSGICYHLAPLTRDVNKKLAALAAARQHEPLLDDVFAAIESDLLYLAELGGRV